MVAVQVQADYFRIVLTGLFGVVAGRVRERPDEGQAVDVDDAAAQPHGAEARETGDHYFFDII